MVPLRVELENFLSFGERQILEFTDDEPLWVLCGPNGVGKSSVFDAITYALFGEHRGGSRNADQLCRHGANRFLVIFEFEFLKTRYEVQRGRSATGPLRRASVWRNNKWEPVPLLPRANRDALREWVVNTLGLDFDAFCASVMLRQGEADRIITASPKDRLVFLRRIIGAERYESLYNRVRQGTTQAREQSQQNSEQLAAIPEVTDDHIEAARQARDQARAALEAAQSTLERLTHWAAEARQWNRLGTECRELEHRLQAAQNRAARASIICHDYNRYRELSQTLPVVRELLDLRAELHQLQGRREQDHTRYAQAVADRDQAAAARDAAQTRLQNAQQQIQDCQLRLTELQNRLQQAQAALKWAEQVAETCRQLAPYDPDLDAHAKDAAETVTRLTEDWQRLREQRAAYEAQLDQAHHRQQEFASVEVGIPCSRCGQIVDAEHAERERAALAAQIAQLEGQLHQIREQLNRSETELQQARRRHKELDEQVLDRNQLRERLATLNRNRPADATEDANQLRHHIAELNADQARLQDTQKAARREVQQATADRDRYQLEWQRCDREVQTLTRRLEEIERTLAARQARHDALAGQLPADWQQRLPTLTPDLLAAEQAELERLRSADIESLYRQLQEDAARRDEWQRQLDQIRQEMERIPAEARRPVEELEQQREQARLQLNRFQSEQFEAASRLQQLSEDRTRRDELLRKQPEYDRKLHLHERLETLLGRSGLQRELVRAAERAIVRYADETCRRLSLGDLTLTLDESERGDEQALALQVRRSGSPYPIPVHFLSGSQKFRVAVAVALAIGRFAQGQARPLESVIIDEGFGSLDRDGLEAMAEELKNLQQVQSLRRLILVSHQEEFTSRFPVGYQLEPGQEGTTVKKFRREQGAPRYDEEETARQEQSSAPADAAA